MREKFEKDTREREREKIGKGTKERESWEKHEKER